MFIYVFIVFVARDPFSFVRSNMKMKLNIILNTFKLIIVVSFNFCKFYIVDILS